MYPVSCLGVPWRAVVNLGLLVLGDGLSSVFMCAFSYDRSVCGFVHMNAGS